jgi:short subunit dehydrogenase-like uncharacterized protein
MEREFEVVVYGATGFTGGLVAEYLAKVPGLRWALAGRDAAKLGRVRDRIAKNDNALASLPLITASAEDPASLAAMAARTGVVLTTVGPYARHGEPLVRACVDARTHYVDLTGEPAFVDAMIGRYHAMAEEARVKIVHSCGFDSIPHDLGALFTVRALKANGPVTVNGYVQGDGQFSGGTWHSAINAFANPGSLASARKERRAALPSGGRRVHGRTRLHRMERLNSWACPLPTIDPDVVLRSARNVAGYGSDFTYGHHVAVPSLGLLAKGALGVAGVMLLAQLPPTRAWLLSKKSPGEGPSPERRAKSWFKVTFVGEGDGRKIVTEVSGGDPGYGETAKMLAESALCLARDSEKLPARYGVVTTAEAMDDVLIGRLTAAGIAFRVVENP